MKGMKGLMMSAVAVTCVYGMTGCSYKVEPHVRLEKEVIPTEKMNCPVVLWVTPTFENYVKDQVHFSDEKVWKCILGPESVDMFQEGLGKVFTKVEVRRGEGVPPRDCAKEAKLVVCPEITAASTAFPVMFKFENYTSKIKYAVKVYNQSGKEVLSGVFEGTGVERGHMGHSSAGHDAIPVSFERAMVAAMKQCLEAMAGNPVIRETIQQ